LFIVDTSAWIFALRKKPLPQLKMRIDQLLMLDIVKTFGMIRLEILGGTRTEEEFDRLKNRIGALEEISCDSELWESAGRLSFDLRRKGLTIPSTDILIASAALKSGSTLLHADSHFDIIASETDLKVERYISKVKKDK